METRTPSPESAPRADRAITVMGSLLKTRSSKDSLRLSLCRASLSLLLATALSGCQLGGRAPLNLPPGIGSPHNSSFKPVADPQTQEPAQSNSAAAPSYYATQVRGQSPDGGNRALGDNDSYNRPMPATVAAPGANNRYTGQATLQPRSQTNLNRNPFSTVNGPTQTPSQLASQPSGVQPPLYTAQTAQPPVNAAQLGAGQQPAPSALPTPPPYGQPQYGQAPYGQSAPVNALPSAPPMDPYASSPAYNQGNYPGAVTPPTVGYGAPSTYQVPGQYQANQYDYNAAVAPGSIGNATSPEAAIAPGAYAETIDPNAVIATQPFTPYQPRERVAPIDVYVQESRTGRIMVGGSVNSDLGLSGQLTIDERNFDITRLPTSWDDMWSGKAFRGRGQNFRAELMPGTRVQRYTVNWSERNFLDTPYSLSVGGFLFTRMFRDWTEQRLGGRVAVGYEITKDLSISTEMRLEDVKLFDPRKLGVAELDQALGSNDLYTGRIRLAHDTRDSPFMSTEGHLLELIYDQVFGEYDYPRGLINYNRYFLVDERPDQTGRHTLASTWRFGFTGADTPIFENFFAGGYSTLRGFRFRGASPKVDDVQVGGQFMFLGSLEYLFPLTADEMLRGVAFVDYGTIERDFTLKSENFRVAPGLGLRVAIPALGPAPLAFDFAAPINKADGDETQVFSFFMGFTR